MKILYDKKNPEIVYLFCAFLFVELFLFSQNRLKHFDSILSIEKLKILPGSLKKILEKHKQFPIPLQQLLGVFKCVFLPLDRYMR